MITYYIYHAAYWLIVTHAYNTCIHRHTYTQTYHTRYDAYIYIYLVLARGKDPSYKGKAYKPCKAGELNKTLEAFENMKKQQSGV